MTTIIEYKPLSFIIDNPTMIKMILNYSIEKDSDLFVAIQRLKKIPLQIWDDNIRYNLIITNGSIIGFTLELKRDDKKESGRYFCMHSIYIIPEQRNKGYCKNVLELYSKTSGCIIADNVMTEIILKLQDKENPDEYLYILHPSPNKDNSRNFYTKSHPMSQCLMLMSTFMNFMNFRKRIIK